MRDIRSDLKERLDAIDHERAKIQASVQDRLSELDRMELGVKSLLQQEEQRFTSANGNGHDPAADSGSTPLARFILGTLHKAKQPLTVDDFKREAKNSNVDFGEKSPGRVLHWALVGMAQGGTVEKENDKWQLKEVAQ